MKITAITDRHRNDFRGVITCEHCGVSSNLTDGYDDDRYYDRVMPAKHCIACGKNRAGEVREAPPVKDTEPRSSAAAAKGEA